MAKEIQRKLNDSIAGLKTAKQIYEIYKKIHVSSITVAVGDDLEKMFSQLGMKGGETKPSVPQNGDYRTPGHNQQDSGQGNKRGKKGICKLLVL